MKPFSQDTDPDAHAVQVALLRSLSPGQRMALTARVRAGAEAMAEARLRATYPDDDDRRIRLRLAALRYGDELMRRMFDWDPEIEGRWAKSWTSSAWPWWSALPLRLLVLTG